MGASDTEPSGWICSACKKPLAPGPRVPCRSCGETARTMGLALQAETKPVAMVRMKKKDPALPAKKQPRVDQMVGQELRVSVGDVVQKERRIDREAGTYSETIRDAEGNVIRHDAGPLADHTGHGSAKPRAYPIAMILLAALQANFPCSAS